MHLFIQLNVDFITIIIIYFLRFTLVLLAHVFGF
jgi:hypothetical protein